MGLYDLLNTIGEVSPNLMLMFDTLRNKEELLQAMEYRLRCKENMEDDETLEMTTIIDSLLDNKDYNDISISIMNGYYLRRTPYRIELRHKDSTTWLVYVMYRDRDISATDIARILKKKYLILIGNSLG